MPRRMFLPLLFLALSVTTCRGDLLTGVITNWPKGGPLVTIGDGTNNVTLWWSLNTVDKGWFYGSTFTGDSDVAFAPSITDISQITDPSRFAFTPNFVGPADDADSDPDGVGDFLMWKNIISGYFGVLRVDDIHDVPFDLSDGFLDGTVWFQTDGSGNFDDVVVGPVVVGPIGGEPIPEQGTLLLLGSGLLGMAGYGRKKLPRKRA